MNNNSLIEKYTPTIIEDIVGNNENKEFIMNYIKINSLENIMLYGPSGVGKTLTSIILKKYFKNNCLFINLSDVRGIEIENHVQGEHELQGSRM